jgi:hypothetical protein
MRLPALLAASFTVTAIGQEVPVDRLDGFYELEVHLGATGDGAGGEGTVAGCLPEIASHTDADFTGGQFVAQAGFAQSEILATSYVLPPEEFPVRLVLGEAIFVTLGASTQTVTEWSFLVWQGTPSTGTLVAEFSSDGASLPHIVLPPGTNGVNVQVMVDPGDPEQIVITDDGSSTFSIGYRIDAHNQQTQNPCFTAPPTCCNAFPTTDTGGLSSPTQNWLFGVNCGPFGCPANGGWTTFQSLPALCTPSGDWVVRATWVTQSCDPLGACCLDTGGCVDDLLEADCSGFGTFQGSGSECDSIPPCPEPTVACCFGDGCVEFTQLECLKAGGVSQGPGSQCGGGGTCPIGACCLPDGECVDDANVNSCLAMQGTYQGNGSDCASENCPLPDGACCFDTGFCIEIPIEDCESAGADWQGPNTNCNELECEISGACCFDTGFCTELIESECENAGATFMGPGTECAPDSCADCAADFDGDGTVGVLDLIEIITNWGNPGATDLDGNGTTDVLDLVELIVAWGDC